MKSPRRLRLDTLEDRAAPTTDPLFSDQWHLGNTAQSGGLLGEDLVVQPAWDPDLGNVTGFGVLVGVVGDGLQHVHPDLAPNYVGLHARDFIDGDNDPTPSLETDDGEGTALAGLIASAADNGIGGAGVAYAASVTGIRVQNGSTVATNAQIASAFTWHPQDIAIYTSGWGPADDGTPHSNAAILAALQSGFTGGRGGLGSIYTWGAGDGQQVLDNVNYDAFANSPYVIAVGAIDHNGVQTEYSEAGAPILVSAFADSAAGAGLTTTDLVGEDGLGPGDYTDLAGGTSAAAAQVAGVVALMLEANPTLTVRDVQDILVRTTRKNDEFDFDWQTNGAGLEVNHKYGFGAVNAFGAVEMARVYSRRGPEVVVTTDVMDVDTPIPDDEFLGVMSAIDVPEDFIVDRVEVKLNATHGTRGDLDIRLYSPTGTESILAGQRPDDGDNYNWTFSTARNWGEASAGTWAVQVSDLQAGEVGTFDDWQLVLHGVSRDPFVSGVRPDVLTYFENQLDLTIAADAGVSDADSATIGSATVAVSGGFASDELVFEDQNGITGTFADGVLTLDGYATMPTYAEALRTILFRNTSENPPEGQRTLMFQVFDEDGNPSNVVTRSLNVFAINDAPSFTVGPDVSVLQNSGPQIVRPWATDIAAGPAEEATQAVFFEVVSVSNPALFSAGPAVSPTGALSFTTANGQFGTATVEVKIRDNGGTANGGVDESSPQSFTISVEPRPIANPDRYTTAEDTPLTVPVPGVLANDTSPNQLPLTAALLTQPANGTVVLNGNGSFTYTPDPNFHGSDTFSYEATDGSLDSPPGTVTITVQSVNDPPVATNDAAATPTGKPVTVNVLANDSDVDADPLKVATFTAAAHGRVTRSGTGLRYTPNAGYQGPDSFTYTVIDGRGGSETALVSVNVTDTTRPTLPAVRIGFGSTTQNVTTVTRGVLPWSGVRRFEFVFSEGVTVSPSALTLTGPAGAVPLSFTAPGANRTAVWTVAGPALGNGRYSLRLNAGLVSDLNGNQMARDYTRSFGLLIGDFDGSGRVTALDVTAIRKNVLTDPTKTNRFADVNGDGVVNQADADLAAANLGNTL
ncbi:MAG TPA: Ig-like domain-containing protein [Gemmataceae bacterium]|nr:Ig-like domain-containing protein [Gemmataceae bacterium]